MRKLPSDRKEILNLDSKNHGALSLISFASDYAVKKQMDNDERCRLILKLTECYSFDMMLKIFKKEFGKYVEIKYGNKIV